MRRHATVLCLGAAALLGLNALLAWGVGGSYKAESARYASVQNMLKNGVSPQGISDTLALSRSFDDSDAFFVAAAAVGSVSIVVLMGLLVYGLRWEGRLVRDSHRLRRSRNLGARVRDLAMEQSPKALAVIDANGRPLIQNAAFQALAPELVGAMAQKLAMPPMPPRMPPQKPQASHGGEIPRQGEREDSTLIWTSPSGEGHRLCIQRWFLSVDRTFSLIALDDPWRPAYFITPPFDEKTPPQRIETDLDANEALARALDVLVQRIELTGADIRAHVLPMVRAVATDLEALFRTLIETALYSEGSGRLLRVDISAHVEDGIAAISIEDNGNGTQAWDLPEILYGRTLNVEATPGVGTRITFDIPVARPDKPGLASLTEVGWENA